MNRYQQFGKFVGLVALLSQGCINFTQAQSIDDLDNEFDALDAQLEQHFEQQDKVLETRFIQVKNAVDRAYKGLTQKISVNWHEDIILPAAQSWTTYDESFSTRATFDFKGGVYQVETIVDGDIAKSLLQLQSFAAKIAKSDKSQLQQVDVFQQSLQQELKQTDLAQLSLIQPQIKSEPYVDVEQILAADTAKIIENLSVDNISQSAEDAELAQSSFRNHNSKPAAVNLDIQNSKFLKAKNIIEPSLILQSTDLAAKEILDNPAVNITENIKTDITKSINVSAQNALVINAPTLVLQTKQSVKRLVLTIPYLNNYQKNLIEGKLDTVSSLANKYQLDVSLILALIETESSFNPMAMSPVPAFGLMQLVPNTAGVDAYEFLYGKKQIVSPAYLFDQNNNLLLGTTYLHLLSKRYLRGIKNQQSKLYCMLASYNTGVGNLAKTFTGKKSINLAVQKINNLQAQQTYEQLMANLPAEETKNYLRKILARKQQYTHFD
ncbi:murein transglycosylase domain-containing protein [Paraglaciecola sp. L3A3]|uniref:transglycosylase SLT domain-containing protein n=1 Tax=Paraglaciecola sp. L3A3 TaxID=2686358 RepID=UPI00131BA255|nr:murein transglycosylase domain-containing protein [Paraglaciecola sp. L3A3]